MSLKTDPERHALIRRGTSELASPPTPNHFSGRSVLISVENLTNTNISYLPSLY